MEHVEPVTINGHAHSRVYSPREKIAHLMGEVCRLAGIGVVDLRGTRQRVSLVNARSCIAVLAEEFYPQAPADTVGDVMLRGKGWTQWARGRHVDRLALYPEYKQIVDYCRANIERLS
jgi:hypothetical protein